LNKNIAILGCGWLGLPLARAFLEAGYRVRGTTTSEEKLSGLTDAGIQAYLLRLNASGIAGDIAGLLKGRAVLIVNIPPGIRSGKGENFVRKIHNLHMAVCASGCRKVVFVSSTSVYGPSAEEITENTPPEPQTPSGIQLLEAEQIFSEDNSLQTIVVRLGGLIGHDRHPVTFLSGRKNLQNGNDLVNLIHREDAVALLKNVTEKGYWGEVFNAVAPEHPAKRDYYTREAYIRGLAPPEYSDVGGTLKKVTGANYRSKGHVFLRSIYST
jgi:nucleoside-diphosphate-sugar epimerase